MKLFINREPVRERAWGGGAWFVNAMYDNAEALGHCVLTLDDLKKGKRPDVILIVGLDADSMGVAAQTAIDYARTCTRQCGIKIPTILRVNDCDARKGTIGIDDALMRASQHVDGVIFVSDWLKSYFDRWMCSNNFVIKNGVNNAFFQKQRSFNNGKINIVTHHWSDNPLKGSDIYEKLDDFVGHYSAKFSFTYIGRHRCNFKHTTALPPLHGKQLGEELGRYDVYVSASRFDPGPNHIIESISCGIPTYVHSKGGGCVEFAGFDHSYDTWEELKEILNNRNFTLNTTTFYDWKRCAEQYFSIFNNLLRNINMESLQ